MNHSEIESLQVMLSSRASDKVIFEGKLQEMSVLRRAIKIACQKTVSESQALRQLGFPDAVLVAAPSGIYVADDVQKIQMFFITNCRDQTTTQHRVQRFLEWLSQEQEDRMLSRAAVSRRRIIDLIAQENAAAAPKP